MIGKRLRLARAAAGMSLRDLASKIGNLVTAQAIGKYERDESMPGSGVLIALAKGLGVSVDYLLGDEQLAIEGVDFRKKASTSRREEAQVEAKLLHHLERYLKLEELLGLASVGWDKPREAPYPARSLEDAEHAAASLRAAWGLGLDPIPNLAELLEERGIKVFSLDANDIGGLTARVTAPGKAPIPIIVVKHSDWGERKRFTLAHELGHMLLDPNPDVDAEKASHRFAGALLMPAEALWREVGKHRTSISVGELVQIKGIFGTSLQAIAYRCRDLGIFGEGLVRRLFMIFNERGWRSYPFKEPGAIDPKQEEPRRMDRLCFRALAENAISEAMAAEILGISVRDLHQRMEAPETVAAE